MSKKRIFSGIQPSGTIHIGNYFGAIENWIRLLDEYECIFSIVDYHAITIKYDQDIMQKRIWDAVLDNIAAGLAPEKCTLFIQSHVPEHTEMFWLLNCVTPIGELSRMTQFKEKSRQHQDNINAGLLNYPILQAADILIYKADAVPVGEDQAQHIEFTREVARKFNSRFGDYFPEPETLIGRGARVMGLDGESKMSKSKDNFIGVTEDPDSIWEKLRPAKTDVKRVRRTDAGNPFDCNIYSYHELVTPENQLEEIRNGCKKAGIGCIDCKKILHENLINRLTPIREKRADLDRNREEIIEFLLESSMKCRKIAGETIDEAKTRMGLKSKLR